MNQRSSHFQLGSLPTAYNSVYQKDYIPKQSSTNNAPQQNPFRGSSLQPQSNQSYFQTTSKQMMQNWGNIEHSKLDPKKLQNLRGHHFTLGNYNPQSVNTSHKLFYDRKPLNQEASSKQEESKMKMRAHNHDFKEQQWTNFQSSYKKDFVGHQGGENQQLEQNHTNINNHSAQNAIVLGNHNVPMISTNAREFTQKKIIPTDGGMRQALQQTSALVLGSSGQQNEPMQTMNQHYFTSKPIQQNKLPQQTMKELRATHFNLGSMKQNYKTEANLYQAYNSVNNDQKTQIPSYQSGTWVDKSAKFNGQSTNQREFNEKPVQTFKKHANNTRAGFQLGNSKPSYQTEFSKNFLQRDNRDARAPIAKRDDNIVIGLDKGSYVTQQRENFKPRDLKQAQGDSAAIKQKNTLDHFKIGGASEQVHLSTYQDEYRKDVENKNKMFHNTKV